MLPLVALALMADVASAHGTPRIRPVECNVLPGERGANVWERAKVPELRRYCDLLASAAAKLAPGSRMVAEVVALADEADRLVAGRPLPMLLKGRALAQLSRHAEALAALRVAKARDERALDDPTALLAWAEAESGAGDQEAAHAAYRALLPRAEALPVADRGTAYLGAGLLAMSLGPPGLAEAIAVLRQARNDSQDLLRTAATFALALALDRGGSSAEAAAVLTEAGAGDADPAVADARVQSALGASRRYESHAIEAFALEVAGKREPARVAWHAFLSDGGEATAWASHAHAHLGDKPAGGGRR